MIIDSFFLCYLDWLIYYKLCTCYLFNIYNYLNYNNQIEYVFKKIVLYTN